MGCDIKGIDRGGERLRDRDNNHSLQANEVDAIQNA